MNTARTTGQSDAPRQVRVLRADMALVAHYIRELSGRAAGTDRQVRRAPVKTIQPTHGG